MPGKKVSNNPKWDIYEAVILLEGYLKTVRKNTSLSNVVRSVSKTLRKMAVNRGNIINDSFRNIAGIYYQIRKMDSAYKGQTVSIPSTSLFDKTVKIYHENKTQYKALLKEAQRMIAGDESNSLVGKMSDPIGAEDFLNYLQSCEKIASRTCLSYVSSIRSSERFARAHGHQSCYIFGSDKTEIILVIRELLSDKEFTEYNIKQHNRFSAAINKLMKFLEIQKEDVVSTKTPQNKRGGAITTESPSSDVERVLKTRFKYGFKKNSICELMKFRRFADEIGAKLPCDDEDLIKIICSVGMTINDKVFCVDNNTWCRLCKMVNDVRRSGAAMAYYENLFEIEANVMSECTISSPEQLKSFLETCVSEVYFAKNFIGFNGEISEKDAIAAEVFRVWGDVPIVKVEELSLALPYISIECIQKAISDCPMFVWVSSGKYLNINLLDISENAENEIIEYVDKKCKQDTFVSIVNLPLDSIEEDYPDVPRYAICNAVYNKVLSDKYSLNGKILSLKESATDVLSLLKSYIADKNECTLDEVSDLIKELAGYADRVLAFRVLYDNMVRVDKKRFVSVKQVNFDVETIDHVIFNIIGDSFSAIREIATFALFPFCGQGWNYYLLESYCYKFSNKYSLRLLGFNDKNAGIIADKSLSDNYNTLLAMRLSQVDLELNSDVIGKYLFVKGFTAKSKYAWLDDLVEQAQKIREGT